MASVREKDKRVDFLKSPHVHMQEWVLYTYAIPDTTDKDGNILAREPDGTVALIKVIGCFHEEAEAEKRAKIEMSKTHCKLVRIERSGEWQRLMDPRLKRRDEYDHFDFEKGVIKRLVTNMNAGLNQKEKEEEREMSEDMKKVVKESKEDDSESLEHFAILCQKIYAHPGLVLNHQEQLAYHNAQLLRLAEVLPKHEAEYAEMLKKHPTYPEELTKLKASYAKS
jgi:hypothetical protein